MKRLGVLALSLLICLGVVKASFAAEDTVKIMVVVVSENIAINIVNVDTNLFSVKTDESTVGTWEKRIIVKNIGVLAANWSLQATNFSNEKAAPDDAAWILDETGSPGDSPAANKCRLMGIFIPYVAEGDWNYALSDFNSLDIIKSTGSVPCAADAYARSGDVPAVKGFSVGTGEDGERTLCLGFDAPPTGTTTGIGEEMYSTLTITAAE